MGKTMEWASTRENRDGGLKLSVTLLSTAAVTFELLLRRRSTSNWTNRVRSLIQRTHPHADSCST